MSFSQMHNDYLDPDGQDRGGRRRKSPSEIRQIRIKLGIPEPPDPIPKTFGPIPAKKLFAYLAELCQKEVDARGLNTHAGAKAAIAKALLHGALDTLDSPVKAPPHGRAATERKPQKPPP